MSRIYKTEGIILSRRDIGEADKLISVFTRLHGKKVGLAKGIRRIKSRRAPHLEPFTYVTLMLHQGRVFDLVTEATTLQVFTHLRKKLERVGFAFIALELVERLTAENQESEIIFFKLLSFLEALTDVQLNRLEAKKKLVLFKRDVLIELGFINKYENYKSDEEILDETIKQILESQLKSPKLLTKIQTGL
jgi:DNA repair protein RecO